MDEKQAVATTNGVKASPLVALGARFNIEPNKLLEVFRGTIIKPTKDGRPATNEEIAAFCIVANQYHLNPFTREIHAFANDKGIVPIVGIDGWCKIVNARDDFNGCEFEEIASQDGAPLQVTCRMHVKGREHPVSVTERFVECNRNTIPWHQMPWRMLRHKAYMQAARYAFGLSGIYDEDEARDIVANARDVVPEVSMPVPRRRKAQDHHETAEAPPADQAPDNNATVKPAQPAAVQDQTPEVKPGVNREEVGAAIAKMMDTLPASKIEKALAAVGVSYQDGEDWQQLKDDAMVTLHSLLAAAVGGPKGK